MLDSRQEGQNKIDRTVLGSVAGRPRRFSYHHESTRDEPMLWVPDIVAGAVSADVIGATSVYRMELAGVLTVVECGP